jgi:hypothetical protein
MTVKNDVNVPVYIYLIFSRIKSLKRSQNSRIMVLMKGSGSRRPKNLRKTGKNHLNEEITPLLLTGIGERFSQTISNLGHAALLR